MTEQPDKRPDETSEEPPEALLRPAKSISYRLSFSTVFLWLLVVLLTLDLGLQWALAGVRLENLQPLRHISMITALTLLGAAVICVFLYTVVAQQGLRTYDRRGRSHYVAWEEMRRVGKTQLLGLGFYFIDCDNRPRLYIGRFLKRQGEFEAVVDALAPPNNTLRRLLIHGDVE